MGLSKLRALALGLLAPIMLLGAFNFAEAANAPGPAYTAGVGMSSATAPTLTVPPNSITGSTSVEKQGCFTLTCGEGYGSTLATASFYPCFKDGVLYKVSTGNSAHVTTIESSSSTTNTDYQFESRTDAPPVGGSAASGTGAVFQTRGTALYPNPTGQSRAWLNEGFIYTFGSATYPQIQVDSNAGYIVKPTVCETKP